MKRTLLVVFLTVTLTALVFHTLFARAQHPHQHEHGPSEEARAGELHRLV